MAFRSSPSRQAASRQGRSACPCSSRAVSARCTSRLHSQDPYVRAAYRVASLISSSDTEEQELSELLSQESAVSRLLLAITAGVSIAVCASAVCWATNSDPLGGASCTVSSLQAGLWGAAAGVPLVAMRELLWMPEAHRRFPVFHDVTETYSRNLAPLVKNMTSQQIAVVLVMEAIPPLMLLLPAAAGIGALAVSPPVHSAASLLHIPLSEPLLAVPALLAAALVAGKVKSLEWDASAEEQAALQTAVAGAESFYAPPRSQHAPAPGHRATAPPGSGREAPVSDAEAFRHVAYTWLANRRVCARTVAILTIVEVLYLGALWQVSGDLTAPCVASLALQAVNCARAQSFGSAEEFANELV